MVFWHLWENGSKDHTMTRPIQPDTFTGITKVLPLALDYRNHKGFLYIFFF